jgi:hypothetical protein
MQDVVEVEGAPRQIETTVETVPFVAKDPLMFIGVVFVMALTGAEIICPLIILGFALRSFVRLVQTEVVTEADVRLLVSNSGLIFFTPLIFLVFFLQAICARSRTIMIVRHACNILVSAFAIFHLILTNDRHEAIILEKVLAMWGTGESVRNFEKRFHCSGVENCLSDLMENFGIIFGWTKRFRHVFYLFWGAVVFYDMLGFCFIAIAFKKFRLRRRRVKRRTL